jgi:hypothetical protein
MPCLVDYPRGASTGGKVVQTLLALVMDLREQVTWEIARKARGRGENLWRLLWELGE